MGRWKGRPEFARHNDSITQCATKAPLVTGTSGAFSPRADVYSQLAAHAASDRGLLATNAADVATSKPITAVSAKTFPSIFSSVVPQTLLLLTAALRARPGGNAALA